MMKSRSTPTARSRIPTLFQNNRVKRGCNLTAPPIDPNPEEAAAVVEEEGAEIGDNSPVRMLCYSRRPPPERIRLMNTAISHYPGPLALRL